MSQRDFYPFQKSSRFMRLFWKAAGADRYILERSTYGDQIKYMCLGGIIIATGVMAGLAGGYAFYTIFEPKGDALNSFKTTADISGIYDAIDIPTMIKAIIFGLIWGLIIFNIDRFIITSTGKGDGTEDITRKELKGALPRIIMGAIIALTISKPVEIRMFKTEIDVKLHEKQIEQQQAFKIRTDSVYKSEIAKKETEISKYQNRISELNTISDTLENHIQYEIAHGGCKGKCNSFQEELAKNKSEISEIEKKPDYVNVKSELNDLEKERQAKLQQSDKVAAGLDGLLERIKLAHEIAGWVVSLFITLLFMAIELTPIFFKLMLIKGPYDYLEENIKELIKAEQGIEIQYNFYQDGDGHEKDKITHHQVIRLLKEKLLILEAQSELSDKAVRTWKEKKLEQITKNPEEYVSEENINIKNG
jgi:hypothetical protein